MKRKLVITLCVFFGLAGLVTAAGAIWYHYNFNASPFRPVQLTEGEKQVLQQKISGQPQAPATDPAKTIVLSEREINGWLQEQGLGDHIKVGLANGIISATALLPMEKDVPFIGGRTVRLKLSIQPRVSPVKHLGLYVSDITIGGISPPNAWLGDIKGRDLLADSGTELDPLAKSFADGIKSLEISGGEIRMHLND